MTRGGTFFLSLLLASSPALAEPAAQYKRVTVSIVPTPRPTPSVAQTPEPAMDLSQALPGKALAKLPSSAQQLKNLASALKQGQPQLASARQKSEALATQATARVGAAAVPRYPIPIATVLKKRSSGSGARRRVAKTTLPSTMPTPQLPSMIP